MIKVENTVQIYEKDGKETKHGEHHLIVKSHWNYNDRVVLEFGEQNITVTEKDLLAAIKNATNIARF